MSAAPIEAKRMTNHDMTLVSVRVTDFGPAKVSRTAPLAAMGVQSYAAGATTAETGFLRWTPK
jgi:hypothetical protein